MSFLSRLFGGSESGRSPKDIDAELARLEQEAENARPGYVGTSFNKAGDLALKDGQGDRAVAYYGRAIDAFLEDEQRELARGVANKIIRVRPAAIRTLCTLTWLDLAAQHQAMALLHLRDYATSAKEGGFGTRAATQIFEMARLSADTEFIDAAADALDMLGFPNRAKDARRWTGGEGSPDAITDAYELSHACLEAAIRSNDHDAELISDEGGDAAEDDIEADEMEAAVDSADGVGIQNDSDTAETEGDADGPEPVEEAELEAGSSAEIEETSVEGDVIEEGEAPEASTDDDAEPSSDDDEGPTEPSAEAESDDEKSPERDAEEATEPQASSGKGKSGKSRKSRKKRKKKR